MGRPTTAFDLQIIPVHPKRMAKWFVAIGVLVVALGILLWQLAAPPETPKPTGTNASGKSLATSSASTGSHTKTGINQPTAIRAKPSETLPEQEESEPELLVPGTDAFGDRLDVVIPNKFRDFASDCYEGGLHDDLKLKLIFQLNIKNKEVFATDIKVLKSELPKELEQCMIAAVRDSRWRADDLPDWSEEHELFIRLRSLKKYKSRREFDEE